MSFDHCDRETAVGDDGLSPDEIAQIQAAGSGCRGCLVCIVGVLAVVVVCAVVRWIGGTGR